MLNESSERLAVIEERLKGIKTKRSAADWLRDGVTIALMVGLLIGIGAYRETVKNLAEKVSDLSDNVKGLNTDMEQISIDVAKMSVAIDRAPSVRSYIPQDEDNETVNKRTAKFRVGRMAAPKLK